MQEIINLMPSLIIAITMNIAGGIYYNVGTQKITFSYKILLTGIIKAAIIVGMFIGVAYCFETTDLSSIGITPIFVMMSAITLYVGKAIISLTKILGIEINQNK